MEMNGGFLVTKIKQLGDRIFEKILSEKNIDAFNGAQGRILYVLWQEDGISIRSLSTKCGLAITSLTTMLERMENQGLISRVQSETDKRKTLLFLTEKAHALKGEYDSVSDEMGSIYYKDFSEEEIIRFEECLDRIRKNLEEEVMSICIKDQIQNMNIVIGCTVGCTYCYARNNVKRWHMIDDFADPEFFPGKLKMMEKKRPQNFLLTGMSDLSSDLSGWKPEWRDEVFAKIRENPQHQFLFLTKRPDLLDFDTNLENAWFGVTVTRKAELWRIDALRKNVRAKHYHVTFEPLFDDPGTVDLSGINWIVVGTMTGAQSRKIHTEPEWAWSLMDQAHKLGIPVFMKEDLVPIIGDENMIQEMPEEFNKVLEVQKSWKK